MSKGTKITSFFEGRRREAFLRSWEHLKSTAGESRIKLDISMPLLNQDVQGMPDAVTKQYAVMCEDKTSTARANLDSFAEGMTIEIFTTDESKERVAMSSGCLLKSWHMITSGEGEKRSLDLMLRIYMPANIDVRNWAWDHLHATFFLESSYSQSEMEFGEVEGGAEPEDEDDDEAETVVVRAGDDLTNFDESDPEPAWMKENTTAEAIPY